MTNKIALLLLISMFVSSCSTIATENKESKPVSFSTFDSLKLGLSDDAVRTVLGHPTEVNIEKDGTSSWLFFDAIHRQWAVVGFDAAKSLSSKVFIVNDSDPESSLSYLLQNQFRRIVLLRTKRPLCYDFIQPDYFLGRNSNVVVELHEDGSVDSIGWYVEKDFLKVTENLSSCPNGRKPVFPSH